MHPDPGALTLTKSVRQPAGHFVRWKGRAEKTGVEARVLELGANDRPHLKEYALKSVREFRALGYKWAVACMDHVVWSASGSLQEAYFLARHSEEFCPPCANSIQAAALAEDLKREQDALLEMANDPLMARVLGRLAVLEEVVDHGCWKACKACRLKLRRT